MSDPLLPILRATNRWFTSEVVAIYGTHILKGTSRRGFRLTEQMFDALNDSALRSALRRVAVIPFGEIALIREKCSYVAKPRFGLTSKPGSHRFSITGSGKTRLKFTLPKSQTASVQNCLLEAAGDQYWQLKGYSFGNLLAPLILALLLTWWLWMLCQNRPGIGAAIIGAWDIWMIALIVREAVKIPRWRQVANDGGLYNLELPERGHVRGKWRKPIRSRVLGWLLKILGVGYWLVIASPLTDGVSSGLKNNFQVAQLIWTLLWLPAPLLIYTGYRLSARGYERKNQGDTRKPIVYLRPFEDDRSTSLQPAGIVAEVAGMRARLHSFIDGSPSHEFGRVSPRDILAINNPVQLLRMVFNYGAVSSEESLARYFEAYGPVIAIGKPGEGLQTPGAKRVYVSDDTWQATIAEELERAQAIVVQPGLSDGVRWELEHLRQRIQPYRVLICLVSFWNNPQNYEALWRLVRNSLQVSLPRLVPYLDRPAFVYFDANWQPQLQPLSYRSAAVWPLLGDATDLSYTLQPFIQGIHGGEREPPRPVRWKAGVARLAVHGVGFVVGLALIIDSFKAVHLAAFSIFGQSSTDPAVSTPEVDHSANTVAISPKVQLRGSAVAYTCEIPAALTSEKSTDPMVEHVRKSPDKHFVLQIVAYPGRDDVSTLAETRLKANKSSGVKDAQLAIARNVQIAGESWTESRVNCKLDDGKSVIETAYATSGTHGTVMICETIVRLSDADDEYYRVGDEIVNSFHYTDQSK